MRLKHTLDVHCLQAGDRHWTDAHHVDSLFVELVAGEGGLGKGVPQASKPTPMPGSSAGSRRDLPCQLLLARAQIAPRAVLQLNSCGYLISSCGHSQKKLRSSTHSSPCQECVCQVSRAGPGRVARKGTHKPRASEMSQAELSVTRDTPPPCATSHTTTRMRP